MTDQQAVTVEEQGDANADAMAAVAAIAVVVITAAFWLLGQ